MKSTIFVVFVSSVFAIIDADPFYNCSVTSSCDACLREPECAWCTDPQINSTPKCLSSELDYTDVVQTFCHEDYLYDPGNSLIYFKARDIYYLPSADSEFSSSEEEENSDGNFISPEHVHASLRVGQGYRMDIHYVVRQGIPVDIYLVMDMKNSRENKNQQLNTLTSSIVRTMWNTTSDFSVGLGYISGSSQHIIHHTSMTKGTSALLHSVEQLVAGELPVSEGAPLGAIVETACSGNVGWRPHSQKIIVFVTDRDYEGPHSVNDGNTGVTSHICSRDFSNNTVQTVYQPSEISDLLNEKQIHVVFAVTDDVAPKYRELQDQMGHSVVTSLTTDTSSVGTLMKNLYMNQSLTISLTDNSSTFMSIKYFTNCLTEEDTETNKCHGVKVGDKIKYGIQLDLLSCPANSSDWNQKMEIRPENLTGQLTLEFKFYCSCPAEMGVV